MVRQSQNFNLDVDITASALSCCQLFYHNAQVCHWIIWQCYKRVSIFSSLILFLSHRIGSWGPQKFNSSSMFYSWFIKNLCVGGSTCEYGIVRLLPLRKQWRCNLRYRLWSVKIPLPEYDTFIALDFSLSWAQFSL